LGMSASGSAADAATVPATTRQRMDFIGWDKRTNKRGHG
jgi:hypothetical protein